MKAVTSLLALCALSLPLCAPASALAETVTKPDQKKAELKTIEQKVEAEKAHQAELKAAAAKLESDMKGLKTNLIDATQSVQKQERALQDIEEKLADLERQKQDMETKLGTQRSSLANLILALERIRRLPPETLVARPDAPLQTAQAATVMGTLLPEINKRAEKLKADLEILAQLEADLTSQKAEAEKNAITLKSDKEKMDKLIADRAQTLKETRQKVDAKGFEIANLTKESKDLRDLIQRLEKRNREIEEKARREARARKAKDAAKTNARDTQRNSDTDSSSEIAYSGPALGTGHLPVSGIIKTRYGETDDIGATSKGLIFSARPASVVVAPLGGIVRYAGEFRNYGKIILIEHKNKFHSLVAGLGKLDTFVGQHVDAGEPLGSLPATSGRLYYELRYQGDPVNPSKKFSKLN